MTWVYFLKAKSKTFEKFKVFRRLVENQTKEKIGTLQTDDRGEFTSNEFQTFCSEKGNQKAIYKCIHSSAEWSDGKDELHFVRNGKILVNLQKFKSLILG
jgi:hypothetical protein